MKLDERGFVLAEFVIALPLLIFLIYSLTQTTLKISQLAREQIADYVLESEIHDVVEKISNDARAAVEIEIKNKSANEDIGEIIFHKYNVVYSEMKNIRDTRRYVVDFVGDNKNHFVLKRMPEDNHFTTPITGDNFFGDTKVTYLKFDLNEAKKFLHISLEMKSQVTQRKIKINTAVYMPSLGE